MTGRLAEPALRAVLERLAQEVGFDYTLQVMPITVAALMTTSWIAPRLDIPPSTTRVILPGYCSGDPLPLQAVTHLPVEFGPRDLRRLPEYFGQRPSQEDFGKYDIEIIAEINHAPRLDRKAILQLAQAYRDEGADMIDIGCEPNGNWSGVADCVRSLKEEGFRVSIDSLNPVEISAATAAGAELVLSVNSSNREYAVDWGCEVVVIPDDIRNLDTMSDTIDFLSERNVAIRLDPILEPIGLDFWQSLLRYWEARCRWPEAELMMGIGNLTELTDVDSSGVNVILLAICQEIGIRSVLTTQVINWARSSVRECDLARRLVYHAVQHKVPPKHLSDRLVVLRDARLDSWAMDYIEGLAARIKDHNYRILNDASSIHVLGGGERQSGTDPFAIFDALMESNSEKMDPSHAFYLGFEMCKALTALQLGKQYNQDEALDWGHLTVPEMSRHRLKKNRRQP